MHWRLEAMVQMVLGALPRGKALAITSIDFVGRKSEPRAQGLS